MATFFQRLDQRARQIDSLLCVGLDPRKKDLEEPTLESARNFCLRLIVATKDLALAYKPNIAFFEVFGPSGLQLLKEIIAAIPEEIPVILDAKRGDVASTAEAYAEAVFQTFGATAVTVNPYLGYDSLEPFVKNPERGAFLLCKTSNPGSVDLQDLPLSGGCLVYEQVASLAQAWNQNKNLGLVVGATYPEALSRVRALAPETWFLVPGVGAQGGEMQAALQAGLRADGLGMLITVSRSLSRAADPRQTAQEMITTMRDQQQLIRRLRESGRAGAKKIVAQPLLDRLLEAGCVKFGNFTLKSGLQSPIYLDLRRLISFPDLLAKAAASYVPILKQLVFDRLAALPYAAIPIGSAISLQGNWPMIYPRKEAKAYGTKAEIEGIFQAGETVVVIDDLATTGSSKFEAIEKITEAGLRVKDVVVLIDRESGAEEALSQAGFRLHSVFKLTEMLEYWQAGEKISQEQVESVMRFISQTKDG